VIEQAISLSPPKEILLILIIYYMEKKFKGEKKRKGVRNPTPLY